MARRRRTRFNLNAGIPSIGLKRQKRLESIRSTTGKEIKELIETDQYQDIEVSDEERTELESGQWDVVSSSNVKAIRLLNKNGVNALQVMFANNAIYEWVRSGDSLYQGLLNSGSKGRAIRQLGLYGTHARRIS